MSTRTVTFALVSGALVLACAQRAELASEPAPPPEPVFTTPDAEASCEGGACPEAGAPVAMCIATACPAPWATCPAKAGAATHRCGTNLLSDQDNCGTCGNACPRFEPLHMIARCVKGGCELECLSTPRPTPTGVANTEFKNCNGLLDDGCEIDLLSDAANCGVCGHACGPKQRCFDGKCGCPTGLTDCNGECVDTQNSDDNCGECGLRCDVPPPDACATQPANTYYGCRVGKCGALKCAGYAADCNSDLGKKCLSNGCEVLDTSSDRQNCGGCGIKCAAGEECRDEGDGFECLVPCKKKGGVLCEYGRCADILNDPDSCGGCNTPCPDAGPNQVRSCTKGVCAVDCASGFADCNGDPADGCETDLRIHQANCGACGRACDIAAGQPCVEGKCLQRVCEPGEAR